MHIRSPQTSNNHFQVAVALAWRLSGWKRHSGSSSSYTSSSYTPPSPVSALPPRCIAADVGGFASPACIKRGAVSRTPRAAGLRPIARNDIRAPAMTRKDSRYTGFACTGRGAGLREKCFLERAGAGVARPGERLVVVGHQALNRAWWRARLVQVLALSRSSPFSAHRPVKHSSFDETESI